jgi:hypothetical protein
MNNNFAEILRFQMFVSQKKSAALDCNDLGMLICRFTRSTFGVDGQGTPPAPYPSSVRITTCICGEVTSP